MKPIRRHKQFEKHFLKRISKDGKLVERFEERLAAFAQGERGYPLDDHALVGTLIGKRAFSVTADVRVVYEETAEEIIFLDIGTHAQVY